jgi:hypothetical protein
MTQDRGRWWSLVNVVNNLLDPKCGEFFVWLIEIKYGSLTITQGTTQSVSPALTT